MIETPPPAPDSGGNVLSTLVPAWLPRQRWARLGRLAVEGVLFAAVGLYLAHVVGVPQSGFFAIFLASAGLTGRLNALLDENRTGIYGGSESPWRVNARTATSVLALFLGVFASYAVAASLLGPARVQTEFGFALEAAHLGQESIFTRRFSDAGALLAHNGLVLATFFVLSFLYRAYGALLALCWNACLWGVVLTWLAQRGVAQSSPMLAVLAVLAVLPHLILEASAYAVGALAAIFLSKGLFSYAPSDPRFLRVLRASALLVLVAIGTLVIAGLTEASLPPLVLYRLR